MDALKIISEGSIKAEKPSSTLAIPSALMFVSRICDRERIQAFEGTVIAKKHGGVAETFTVRRVAYGVGIERVFPVNSPSLRRSLLSARARSAAQSCSICVAVRARLPRSRAIFDHPRFENGRKGTTCCPFFLFQSPGVCKIRKGWWLFMKNSSSPPAVRGQGHTEWYEALISAALVCWY